MSGILSIVGINKDYYEAACLDGAGKIKQFFSITLPQLKPTIITTMILSIGAIFRSDFGLFYQVTKNSGALYDYTRTIDVYDALPRVDKHKQHRPFFLYRIPVDWLKSKQR